MRAANPSIETAPKPRVAVLIIKRRNFIGSKQKEPFESILPDCCLRLQEIYKQTQEGNGQKWLMVDMEDVDDIYRDAFHIIEIRKSYK